MKANELREKNAEELQKELLAQLETQFKLRMQQGAGQSPRPSEFTKVRRDIARIKTVLTEKSKASDAS